MNNSRLTRIPLLYATFLIVVLSSVTFWPSLKGDFVFDDTEAIVNNADVTTSPIIDLFRNDFWGRPLNSSSSHKSYRPLTVLSFRLNYHWHGKLVPIEFHVVNIALHCIVCILLLLTYTAILEGGRLRTSIPQTALLASILFTVHPVHSENVAGIVGRADILSALFFFMAFLLFCHQISITRERLHSIFIQFSSFLLFMTLAILSFLCKEQGIMLLPFCCSYDMIHLLASKSKNDRKVDGKWSYFIVCTIILGFEALAIMTFRFWIMNWQLPDFQEEDNPASFLNSRIQRVANYNYLYCINSWILLCPQWLCFDWSMGCVPLITEILDVRLLAIVLFWTVTITIIIRSLLEIKRCFSRSLSIALALVILPFIPASNSFVRVGFVVAERVLYISSAGFCLIIACGYQRLRRVYSNQMLLIAVILLIALFSVRSYKRSREWCTEKELYSSALDVCSLNAKVYYNIAKNSADNGNKTFAIQMYEEALRLNPKYDQAMNNLANILRELKRLNESKRLLEEAVKLRSDFAAAWMNLGIVEMMLKNFSGAEQCYLTALSHRQRYPDCYYNLGNMYLEQKHYDKAFEAWSHAVKLKPSLAVAWNNMVIMLDNIGRLNEAKKVSEEALKVVPHDASVHFNYANALGKSGNFVHSEKHFKEAIRQNNNNPTFFTNLGVLYHRWKRYSEAEIAYSQALQLDPTSQGARDNLRLLRQAITNLKNDHE